VGNPSGLRISTSFALIVPESLSLLERKEKKTFLSTCVQEIVVAHFFMILGSEFFYVKTGIPTRPKVSLRFKTEFLKKKSFFFFVPVFAVPVLGTTFINYPSVHNGSKFFSSFFF
jgi:hypothetical protein